MPPPKSGSIEWHKVASGPHKHPRSGDLGHWDVRATLPDGTRSKRKCFPELDEKQARAKALSLTKLAAKNSDGRAKREEPQESDTFEKWSERWCKWREERGLTSVKDDRGRLKKWINPSLGPKSMKEIVRIDIERLVEKLDLSVRAGELSWKTARSVWGVVSKAFDDACNAKALALRVIPTNPAAGVRGPDRGAAKGMVYLYPSEFLALASCKKVPHRWRRIYALATYTYTRASELMALEWTDIDFEGCTIRITRSLDKKGNPKPTKTKESRRIPIEPALLPLLRAMHEQADGKGRIITLPRKKMSDELRMHLGRAGVKRAELFDRDETRKRLTFHDAGRATGITWMALRGDDPLRIQRRAGHADFNTTQGYIREAETLGRSVGQPFPPLPEALLKSQDEGPESGGSTSGSAQGSAQKAGEKTQAAETTRETSAGWTGLEGADSAAVTHVSAAIAEVNNPEPYAASAPNYANPRPWAEPGQDESAVGDASKGEAVGAEPVVASLAVALERAAAAGRWDVVAQLARELEARRLASSPNVVQLPRKGVAHLDGALECSR